jgi:hypothetical protein
MSPGKSNDLRNLQFSPPAFREFFILPAGELHQLQGHNVGAYGSHTHFSFQQAFYSVYP